MSDWVKSIGSPHIREDSWGIWGKGGDSFLELETKTYPGLLLLFVRCKIRQTHDLTCHYINCSTLPRSLWQEQHKAGMGCQKRQRMCIEKKPRSCSISIRHSYISGKQSELHVHFHNLFLAKSGIIKVHIKNY